MGNNENKLENSQHDTEFLRDELNKRIIDLLNKHKESGFKRGFHEFINNPMNPATQNFYNGHNEILLNAIAAENNYGSSLFMPFKDISGVGASVIKGQKSHKLLSKVQVKHYDPKGNDVTEDVAKHKKNGEAPEFDYFTESRPITYGVWNIDQVRNLPDRFKVQTEKSWADETEVLKKIDELTNNLGIQISPSKKAEVISYDKSKDMITTPPRERIKSDREYIDAILPLICEATSHPDRLNRTISNLTESKQYLNEKLSNELAASSLGQELGFCKSITNDEKVITEWKRMLESDPYFFIRSTYEMKKTLKFIRDKSRERQMELESPSKKQEKSQDQKQQELEKVQAKKKHSKSKGLAKA